jgi:ribosomal protein L32
MAIAQLVVCRICGYLHLYGRRCRCCDADELAA